MSTNNKPLSYEGSKAVLQYLGANTRFQLSSCCPSLQNIDRLVPLHIDQLIFRSDKFLKMKVNSEEYYIGLYRSYPPGVQFPFWHHDENETGGVEYDIDQFGFRDNSNVILPGDVVLDNPNNQNFVGGPPFVPNDNARPTDDQLIEQLERRAFYNSPVAMDRLQALKNRRDNVTVPYERLAQLTIKRSDGSKNIHRFRGRIYEAQKSLYNLMFGDRKCPIIVRKLDLYILHLYSSVIRFPIGMTLKVKELSCLVNQIDSIRQVIDSSSFPLKSFEIYKKRFGFDHPCIQEAHKSIIKGVRSIRSLIALKNQKVYVKFPNLPYDAYINLVERWKNIPRPIGTCFTFGQYAGYPFPKITKMIKKKFNGTRVGNRLVKVPVDEDSRIHVSYESVEWGKVELILKLEMVAI